MSFGSSFGQAELDYRRERILAAYRPRRSEELASLPDPTVAGSRSARRARSFGGAKGRR